MRIFNPFAKSHLNSKLETVFKAQENQKKKSYNERVIKIEHGSFTPVVLSAFGGAGRETGFFLSKLAEKISEKHDIHKSKVSNYIRTKISFELVRAQCECLRGSRSRRQPFKLDVRDSEVVDRRSTVQEL